MPMEKFRAEASDSPSAAALLDAFETEIAGLYPGFTLASGPSAGPADFAPPAGRFLVAYDGERPVACGGLKRLDARSAELKRLYVVPEARRRGVARRLIGELESVAREQGYSVIRLDTGANQPGAARLFESLGYRPIADYNANPYAALWFERPL